MADEGNTFVGEGVDDVQQVLCRTSQAEDALDIEGIAAMLRL